MNNRWTFRMIDTDLELEHNFVVIQSRWWARRHKSDNYLLRGRGEKLDWKHDTTLSWPQRDRRGGSFITEIPGRELHLIYINSEPERLLVLFQMITAVWGMTMEGVMMWPGTGGADLCDHQTPIIVCWGSSLWRPCVHKHYKQECHYHHNYHVLSQSPAPSRPHNWGHLDVSRYQDNSRLCCHLTSRSGNLRKIEWIWKEAAAVGWSHPCWAFGDLNARVGTEISGEEVCFPLTAH